MRVVLALDSFKGTLSAQQACEFLAEGMRHRNRKAEVVLRPMSDGGEGSAQILAASLGMQAMRVEVPDLLGVPCEAHIYWHHERRIALVESAEVLGVHRTLAREEYLQRSSSLGLGKLLLKSLDLRPAELWIGVGGTMTADAGWGVSSCFGLHALNEYGDRLEPSLQNMEYIHGVVIGESAEHLRRTRVVALCDVNAPAVGAGVSLSSFLPQKGASQGSIPSFLKRITTFWELVRTLRAGGHFRMEDAYMGAGGGLCCGLSAVFPQFSAELGAKRIARSVALEQSIAGADLVVCGEGALDEQTLYGKVPSVLSEVCASHGIPLVGVFGKIGKDGHLLSEKLGLKNIYTLFDCPAPQANDIVRQSRLRLFEIGEEIISAKLGTK